MIAGTTSGIEPAFSLSYTKHVLDGAPLLVTNAVFRRYIEQKLSPLSALHVLEQIAVTGTARGIRALPEEIQKIFVTSPEISPQWHVRMQAAFQAHCDNAVSKTVLISPQSPPEVVGEIFRLAYRLGCKGITVYRAGSRPEEAITYGKGYQSCSSCSN
ncbi:MAG: hypothetical protein ACYCX4_06205 [Bacillota bacterium]